MDVMAEWTKGENDVGREMDSRRSDSFSNFAVHKSIRRPLIQETHLEVAQ